MSIIDLLKLHWMVAERLDCTSPFICFNDGDGDGGDGGGDGDDGDGADGAGGAGDGADGGGDGDDDGDDDADDAADADVSDPGADPEADFDFQGFDPDITAPDAPAGAPAGYGAMAGASPEDVEAAAAAAAQGQQGQTAADKEAAAPFDTVTVDAPENQGLAAGQGPAQGNAGQGGQAQGGSSGFGGFGGFGDFAGAIGGALGSAFGVGTASAEPAIWTGAAPNAFNAAPDVAVGQAAPVAKDPSRVPQTPFLQEPAPPFIAAPAPRAVQTQSFTKAGMGLANQGPEPGQEFQDMYEAMFGPVGTNPQGLSGQLGAQAGLNDIPDIAEPAQVAQAPGPAFDPQVDPHSAPSHDPHDPFDTRAGMVSYDPSVFDPAAPPAAPAQNPGTVAAVGTTPAGFPEAPAQVAQAPGPAFDPQVDPHSTPSQDPNQGPFDARAGMVSYDPAAFSPAAPPAAPAQNPGTVAAVAATPQGFPVDWVNAHQEPAPAPSTLGRDAGLFDINANPLGQQEPAPEPPPGPTEPPPGPPEPPPGPPSGPPIDVGRGPTGPLGPEPGPELPASSPPEPGPIDGGPILPPSLAARSSGRDSITKALMDQNGGTPAAMYQSYLEAGFSPDQARQMVLNQMQNAPQVPGY